MARTSQFGYEQQETCVSGHGDKVSSGGIVLCQVYAIVDNVWLDTRYEPPRGKTNNLQRGKQRRRSASQ